MVSVRSALGRIAVGLALGLGPLLTSACAAVWGFEPLSEGASRDGGGDARAAETERDGATGSSGGGEGGTSTGPGACNASGSTCTCSATGTGGGTCGADTLGAPADATVCCADPAWPSNGACTCQAIGCATSAPAGSPTCLCGPGNGAPGGSCAEDPGWTCCRQASATQCLCAAAACLSGFEDVGHACAPADVRCPAPQRAVDRCR